jgi:OOP family OmpA-OmpF porin
VAEGETEVGAVAAALAEAGGVTIPATAPPETSEACVGNIKTLLEKDKITFEPGSDDIADSSSALIEAVATLLKQCPSVPIEVGGHTDSQGSSGGNQRLSEGRAKAVLVALKEKGVDVATMKAVGYGEAKPVADNDTGDGREANRRIEFTLITPAGTAPVTPEPAAAAPATSGQGPDFSADSSPSIAPQEKTLRPVARPANNG